MATYKRVLPRTLLPLDRWAQIVGLDPRHFRQVTTTLKPLNTCAAVWLQYSWQQAGQLGRYDVANAIQQAEDVIAQYLGYKLLPTYEEDEKHQLNVPGNTDILFLSGYNNKGFRKSVQANWGHFVEAGSETSIPIKTGATVTYSDEDGDGYDETATITSGVTYEELTSENVRVYYPSESGADEWEIRPARKIQIAESVGPGGTQYIAAITLWKHQLVKPDLVEAISPDAVDGDDNTNFLSTVDIYKHYTDTSNQATIYWYPNTLSCCCDSSTTCCPVCDKAEQDACLNAKDYASNVLMYQPGEYDDGWTAASPTCCRNPDMISINYRAGLQNMRLTNPTIEMDPQWERAVAYYALTLLDRDMCGCDPAKSIYFKMKEDMAKGGINVTNKMLECPLGTTRAALMVWNMISNEPNRVLSQAVRW